MELRDRPGRITTHDPDWSYPNQGFTFLVNRRISTAKFMNEHVLISFDSIEVNFNENAFDAYITLACHGVYTSEVDAKNFPSVGTNGFVSMKSWGVEGQSTEASVVASMKSAGYRPAQPIEFLAWIAHLGERGKRWKTFQYVCIGHMWQGKYLGTLSDGGDDQLIVIEHVPDTPVPQHWLFVAVKI